MYIFGFFLRIKFSNRPNISVSKRDHERNDIFDPFYTPIYSPSLDTWDIIKSEGFLVVLKDKTSIKPDFYIHISIVKGQENL